MKLALQATRFRAHVCASIYSLGILSAAKVVYLTSDWIVYLLYLHNA